MAVTKTEEIGAIEVVQTCIIQVAMDTVIKEDGVEISRTRKRYSIIPCGYSRKKDDTPDKWVWNDTDVSDQPQQVQDICNTVWTDALKADYKAKVIAQG